MKSAKLLVALAATGLVATSAFAQKSAFEGFYGQIATGYENNTIQNQSLTATNPGFGSASSSGTGTTSSGNAPLIVGLGYTFTINQQFNLGLGADYSTISQTTSNTTANWGAPGDNTTFKGKISNRYNIFLAPGYAIDKDKLAYFKVGYSNEKLSVEDTGGSQLGSATTGGYVLGLGYKQIITGGFYGFAEANYYNYSKPTISKSFTEDNGSTTVVSSNPGLNAYNLLVGVGYKF